jgi:hypothetical protein
MRFRHASARVGRIVAYIVGPATYPSTCRGTRWGHDLRPAASVRLSRRQAMGSLAGPHAGTVSGLPARGGCRARISRLLAIRATEITCPEGRRELTQCWDRILHEDRRPPIPRPPCAPLCRDRVAAAERDVRDMLTVLAGPLPITADGAAMASFLRRDGTGPLHDRHSPRDMGSAVREAARLMMRPFTGAPSPGNRSTRAGCYR